MTATIFWRLADRILSMVSFFLTQAFHTASSICGSFPLDCDRPSPIKNSAVGKSSSARTFLRSSMLSNVGCGQIKPAGRTRLEGLKTESQGFVADTSGFLYCDMVRSPEKGDWRIYRHYVGLRATHLEREIKFSATIRQSAISKVANSGSMAAHAASSVGAIDAPGKALWSQDGSVAFSADGMQK
jgi:hypothetical protein